MVQAVRQEKKTTGGGTGRRNALGDFVVAKVDSKVMRDFIRGFGIKLEIDDKSNAEQIALALTLHFRDVEKDKDAFCKCEVCFGEAPDSYNAVLLDACPFCGLESADSDEAKADTAEASEDDDPGVEGEDDNEDDDNEIEDDDDDEEDADDDGDDDDEEEPEVTAAPVVSTKSAAKPAKETTMTTTANHTNGKSTALATTKGAGAKSAKALSKYTAGDLDKAVAEVIELKTNAAQNVYDLGRKILEINERNLWKLRLDENGKARYSGFDAFVHHELKMSSTHAFNMIAWARQYTADDIAKMGHTKAAIIMKAPPEDRKALAEKAKSGASKRTIEKEVAKAKKKRNYEGATRQAKAGAKGAKKRSESVAQDKITVAKIEGLKTVKLYAKPASLKNLDLDKCKRAKSLTDEPFGRLELVNGVSMYISITKGKDGALIAKVNTQRESPVSGK